MKRNTLLLAAGLLLATSAAFAQTSASASANAITSIYVPITVTKTADLSFGDVFPGTAVGHVIINPQDSTTSFSGTGVSLGVHAGSPATYTMTGKQSASFSLALPANGAVNLTGPGTPIPVNTFRASIAGAAPVAGPVTSALTVGGTQAFKVGADMTVGIAQLEGTYAASYNVTVTYN